MNKKMVFVAALALLTGCATAAQRQAQQIKVTTQSTVAQLKSCVAAVYNSAVYNAIRPHLPLDIRDATLEQMTSTAKVTDEEIKAIYAQHPQMQACRKTALESLEPVTPTLVPILADEWDKNEQMLIELVQRKITWGEYVTRGKERTVETTQRLTAAAQQIDAGLQRSYEAEMAQRQRAADAMMQFHQNQQLINSLNRPVITNCQGFGNMVNCVSN
jgi:hypothetical protein